MKLIMPLDNFTNSSKSMLKACIKKKANQFFFRKYHLLEYFYCHFFHESKLDIFVLYLHHSKAYFFRGWGPRWAEEVGGELDKLSGLQWWWWEVLQTISFVLSVLAVQCPPCLIRILMVYKMIWFNTEQDIHTSFLWERNHFLFVFMFGFLTFSGLWSIYSFACKVNE